jgi:hypothetical protein
VNERINEAHGPWLKNGNIPLDLRTLPRCGAKTRSGGRCGQPAMKNGKCRFHGGLSTGPRTRQGLARSRKARWKHGEYSAQAKEERRWIRSYIKECEPLLREMEEGF